MSYRPARRARRAAERRKAPRRRASPAPADPPVKGAVCPRIDARREACLTMQWRALFESMNDTRPMAWYGNAPWWRVALEGQARRVFGDGLMITEWPGQLEYRVALDVRGPAELVEAQVVFYASPPYQTYGLPPCDYPRVFAERYRPSKHRMPDDDALCLYYPRDPDSRRWTADKGLLDLLDLTVDHLCYEAYWRATGGENGGVWLGDEADHGIPRDAAA